MAGVQCHSGQEVSQVDADSPTVTLVAGKDWDLDSLRFGTSFVFTWVCLAPLFDKFSGIEHQNTKHVVPFHSETLQKLERALSDPIAPKMNGEDDRLLRWLGCKSAKPYQLYSHE